MRGITGYMRGASAMAVVAAAIAGAGLALAGTSAHITSVTMSGTSAAPEITVRGSGFGSRPAPNPSYPPEGKSGCPVEPAARAGHLYGSRLYFADLNAKRGSFNDPGPIRAWTAGQSSSGQFDCIGIVIDRWTSTQVRFHFGDVYGKFLPQNTYFLSNGDRVQVFVQGAGFLVARTAFVRTAKASARISSVGTSGTSVAPEITVKGSGFGRRPAPSPSYPPVGKNGCPNGPAGRPGHLYGTELYLTDLKAKKGTYKNWTAGQYTPGGNGFFDCIGLVVDHWSSSEVRFHFGDTYAKPFPGNTYVLSNGDRFKVFVRRATFVRTAKLG